MQHFGVLRLEVEILNEFLRRTTRELSAIETFVKLGHCSNTGLREANLLFPPFACVIGKPSEHILGLPLKLKDGLTKPTVQVLLIYSVRHWLSLRIGDQR
jgi:hypothetical protein